MTPPAPFVGGVDILCSVTIICMPVVCSRSCNIDSMQSSGLTRPLRDEDVMRTLTINETNSDRACNRDPFVYSFSPQDASVLPAVFLVL